MKKILYFISGPVPTKEQEAEAAALGALFRNAAIADKTGFVESCDAVAGDVPERYVRFPVVGGEAQQDQPSVLPVTPPAVDIPAQPEVTAEEAVEPEAQQQEQPDATGHVEQLRAALMEKTVKEQREIAKANGIPLPADINTKEEIADYVSKVLAQS